MDFENVIDYEKIVHAEYYYKEQGYKRVEVPWVVSQAAIDSTKPDWVEYCPAMEGYLPGSAEQAFIHLMLEGKGPFSRAYAITPCFRPEPEVNELSLLRFMKLELIQALDVNERNLNGMIQTSVNFFERFVSTKVIDNDEGWYDIVEENTGIELGSYGIRNYKNINWIYGTGVAEPRLTTVFNKLSHVNFRRQDD